MSLGERSLSIREKVFTPHHVNVAASLNTLGDIYLRVGRWDEADAVFRRSLAITEKAIGELNPTVAGVLNNLAIVCMRKGDYPEASALYRQALAIMEKSYGTENPNIAVLLLGIGDFHQTTGDLPTALKMYQRSERLFSKGFGAEHPSVAKSLIGQAQVLCEQGNFGEALRLHQRALAILEKKLGSDHPLVAASLVGLSRVALRQQNLDLAWSAISRVAAILDHAYESEHPVRASVLGLMAIIHAGNGDFENARSMAKQSLSALENSPSPSIRWEAAGVYRGLANVYLNVGQPLESIYLLAESLRHQRRILAQDTFFSSMTMRQTSVDVSVYEPLFMLHSLCAHISANLHPTTAEFLAAEALAMNKALLEEVETERAKLQATKDDDIRRLMGEGRLARIQLDHLPELKLSPVAREEKWNQLQKTLRDIEMVLAEKDKIFLQAVRERSQMLIDIARAIPDRATFIDFVLYPRFDPGVNAVLWQESRYAAYLTFPLAKDSTNVVVERLDLGEATPINEAVELICRRMGAGQFRARDLEAALQRVSERVYAPLARHLTNVSHLMVCPDGQLSRVPFEMLLVSGRGEPPRYLVEEKTISYVTSGREVARLAQLHAGSGDPAYKGEIVGRVPSRGAPVVMGNPDFDLDLTGRSSRREEAQTSKSEVRSPKSEMDRSLLTSAATRSLSRSYRGIEFDRLPGSEQEARGVAKLLGNDTVLRLGKDAREAELKAVVSPRVLHLATHGFFLTDQEFKRTNALPLVWSSAFTRPRPPEGGTPNDWENPMVRCGIALAGANHARQITNAAAEDGLLTGLEASLLNLQGTELVILSACESGAGEVKIGEGVMSLRRAFRIAGAETVLASHWKVSDKATSQLMTEFMRRWRDGEPRGKAWHEAQLSLLRSKGSGQNFSNPYFWAAFTLTGQWR